MSWLKGVEKKTRPSYSELKRLSARDKARKRSLYESVSPMVVRILKDVGNLKFGRKWLGIAPKFRVWSQGSVVNPGNNICALAWTLTHETGTASSSGDITVSLMPGEGREDRFSVSVRGVLTASGSSFLGWTATLAQDELRSVVRQALQS